MDPLWRWSFLVAAGLEPRRTTATVTARGKMACGHAEDMAGSHPAAEAAGLRAAGLRVPRLRKKATEKIAIAKGGNVVAAGAR
jgi:hypothetical protein